MEESLALFCLSFAAATVHSMTGMGYSLLIIPPLALLVGTKEAVVTSNTMGALLGLAMLRGTFPHIEWRTFAIITAASLVGMPLGLLVLISLEDTALQVGIAILVMLFTVLLARGVAVSIRGHRGDVLAGFVSGVLRTSTSMSGPPVGIHLQGRGLPPERFRATVAAVYTATGVLGAAWLAIGDRYTGDIVEQCAAAAPALVPGLLVGTLLFRRTQEALFRRVVVSVLFASAGLALIAA